MRLHEARKIVNIIENAIYKHEKEMERICREANMYYPPLWYKRCNILTEILSMTTESEIDNE